MTKKEIEIIKEMEQRKWRIVQLFKTQLENAEKYQNETADNVALTKKLLKEYTCEWIAIRDIEAKLGI